MVFSVNTSYRLVIGFTLECSFSCHRILSSSTRYQVIVFNNAYWSPISTQRITFNRISVNMTYRCWNNLHCIIQGVRVIFGRDDVHLPYDFPPDRVTMWWIHPISAYNIRFNWTKNCVHLLYDILSIIIYLSYDMIWQSPNNVSLIRMHPLK